MADPLQSEPRIVSLLGIVAKTLHDEWHREIDGATSDVRDLSDRKKGQSSERLGELLNLIFPGKSVTVTDDDGKTLFEGEKTEEEETEKEDEET